MIILATSIKLQKKNNNAHCSPYKQNSINVILFWKQQPLNWMAKSNKTINEWTIVSKKCMVHIQQLAIEMFKVFHSPWYKYFMNYKKVLQDMSQKQMHIMHTHTAQSTSKHGFDQKHQL
jgi:hypothetical protein